MMSKPIELSLVRGSSSTMSQQGDTDVGGTAPLYSSIEAAQDAAQDAAREFQEDTEYTTPGPMDPLNEYSLPLQDTEYIIPGPMDPLNEYTIPLQDTEYITPGAMDPLNEYSLVSDNQREPSSPGFNFEQTNELNPDQFAAQHATLTRSTGRHSNELEKSICTESCCNGGRLSAVVGLCVFATYVAMAALLMIILVIVGVIPVCSCAASPQKLQELMYRVGNLTAALEETQVNVTNLDSRLENFDVVPDIEQALSERVAADGTIIGVSYTANLIGFDTNSGCVTSQPRKCPIASTQSKCETPDYNIDEATQYIASANCLRDPSPDPHHLSATLSVMELTNPTRNVIFCVCQRIIESGDSSVAVDVMCVLQVTVCERHVDIPVTVVTTSNLTRT